MSQPRQPSSASVGSTSSSLLDRVRARDPDAWEKLARLYCPLVYHWARQQHLQDADAADVVQEVFRTVAQRIDDFHRDRPDDTFRGWLRGITRNKLGDYFRRVAAHPPAAGGSSARERLDGVPDLREAPAEDGEAEASLAQRALQILRTEFEDTTWQAFWGAAIDGRAAAEIARDLGMTPRAVRQAKYRVLRRLRQELGGGMVPGAADGGSLGR
jgi:RNA polymerase sigma-70 factor (ECF subfamily)